jgi:hypothetical protein
LSRRVICEEKESRDKSENGEDVVHGICFVQIFLADFSKASRRKSGHCHKVCRLILSGMRCIFPRLLVKMGIICSLWKMKFIR